MVNKHTLFRPSKAETKADRTTQIARDIIGDEASARDAKTARLRAARLEREASEKAQKSPAPQKKARKKSAAKPASDS